MVSYGSLMFPVPMHPGEALASAQGSGLNSSRSLCSKSTVPSAILTVSCSRKHRLGQIWSIASQRHTGLSGLVFLRCCSCSLSASASILRLGMRHSQACVVDTPLHSSTATSATSEACLMWTRRYPESQLTNYCVITIIAMLPIALDSLTYWASIIASSGVQVVQIVTLVFPQLQWLPPHLLPLLCLATIQAQHRIAV